MGLALVDTLAWSEQVFGKAQLGDKRLTKRLVTIGKQLSSLVGSSLSKSCEGNSALLEGGYRFLRNNKVSASDIAEAGYASSGDLAQDSDLILAIEDTTSVVYSHEVSKQLGYTGNKPNSKAKGYQVHSTLLMDAKTEKTIGLVAQNRWCRDPKEYGKRSERVTRAYEEKESYKWEKNSREIASRLGDKMKDTLSVCDRDADVYEYMQYKQAHGQRFIVRATQNRCLYDVDSKLRPELSKSTRLGTYTVEIAQKKERPRRKAVIALCVMTLTFRPPERRYEPKTPLEPITVNVVYAKEKNPPTDDMLEWILLTTEDISTFEDARRVTRYYELRWRVEDFHKAWKSGGTNVEAIKMQSADNLEKMMVILSFVAVRLLQLKEHFEQDGLTSPSASQTPCSGMLSDIEWKVLWKTREKKLALPKQPPSAAWAFNAIARLGGWTDSKKSGRASWMTIWDGWFRLSERVQGFLLAQEMMQRHL